MDGPLVLVVDDDREIRDLVSTFLQSHGFRVAGAANGREMDARLAEARADLIVLDLMLPGEDGLAICRRLAAAAGPPVIMLSALGEETDRIVGLELGADDYLPKPCSPRELLARIRAVLRRHGEAPKGTGGSGTNCYRFDGWSLDPVSRRLLSPGGEEVLLSGGEFHLLRAFAERPHHVLTRDQLLDMARGLDAEVYDRSIDVQVSRLRRKLGDGTGRELIRTVRNEGYMFSARVARQ